MLPIYEQYDDISPTETRRHLGMCTEKGEVLEEVTNFLSTHLFHRFDCLLTILVSRVHDVLDD